MKVREIAHLGVHLVEPVLQVRDRPDLLVETVDIVGYVSSCLLYTSDAADE